jgi:hypothetical protein
MVIFIWRFKMRPAINLESSPVKYPAKPTWCEISQNHFQLDPNAIPFSHSLNKRTYDQRNADHHSRWQGFWDIGHARKGQSNRRKRLPQYAVWEIHPVMALHVVQ